MKAIEDLKVTLVQSIQHWEDIDGNLGMFEEKLWQFNDPTDLIILPEMFTTGFSMNARKLAEVKGLKTMRWLEQMASQKKAMIMGSFIANDGGKFYNRMIAMKPDGSFHQYDKRHPFSLAEEDKTYTGGKEKVVFNLNGWKICPMICYDLRFPVWSRNVYSKGELEYDILIYVANWPAPRVNAWDTLLAARAIENMSYCVGVNRVGKDEKGHQYLGHSAVYDFGGKKTFYNEGEEVIETATLDYSALTDFRKKFGFFLDADSFTIHDM
ncbi:MAG: amidohydrolase [Cyclobacteriaceae bacterium]